MIKISFDFDTPEQAAEFLAGFDEPTKKRAASKATSNVQNVKSKLAKAAERSAEKTCKGDAGKTCEGEPVAPTAEKAEREVAGSEAAAKPTINKAAERIMARYPDVDWDNCPASGKKGSVLKADVVQHLHDLGVEDELPRDGGWKPNPDAPDKPEMAAALQELLSVTAAYANGDKKIGRDRGMDLLRFFGAEKLSDIKIDERRLFLNYAKLGSVLSPTWTPTHMSKLFGDAGRDIDKAMALAAKQEGFIPADDEESAELPELPEGPQEPAESESGTEAQTPPEKADGAAEAEPDAGVDVALLDVQKALQHLLYTKGLSPAMDLLKKYGVQRVANLSPDQYPSLLEDVEKAGGSE